MLDGGHRDAERLREARVVHSRERSGGGGGILRPEQDDARLDANTRRGHVEHNPDGISRGVFRKPPVNDDDGQIAKLGLLYFWWTRPGGSARALVTYISHDVICSRLQHPTRTLPLQSTS